MTEVTNRVLVVVQSPKWGGPGQATERDEHRPSGGRECWPGTDGRSWGHSQITTGRASSLEPVLCNGQGWEVELALY